jgi:hypothetical protein
MADKPLTLIEARKLGRLGDFITQAERQGIGPADMRDFDRVVATAVKPKRSKGRTSRSPSRDDSRGK